MRDRRARDLKEGRDAMSPPRGYAADETRVIPATWSHLTSTGSSSPSSSAYATVLANRDTGDRVVGAEHLLAALECLGVDNVRIEVAGGDEVPALEGGALGWSDIVHRTGLVPAPSDVVDDAVDQRDDDNDDASVTARYRPVIQEMIRVEDPTTGSFCAFFPGGDECVVSAGVDWEEVPLVGKKWAAWSVDRGDHFMFEIANAKHGIPSKEAYISLYKAGYLTQLSEQQMALATGGGKRWAVPAAISHVSDEPARHRVLDLLGDLSTLARPGHSGLPKGHVVMWKGYHALQARFVQALGAAIETGEGERCVERELLSEEAARAKLKGEA